MRVLSEAELLDAWECGLALPPSRRGLELLDRAWDEEVEPGRLSAGERQGKLLELRGRIFGRRCDCRLGCPACGEQLELELDLADLLAGEAPVSHEPFALAVAGYDLRVRLPDGHDVAAVAGSADVPSGVRALLRRCVLEAACDGAAVDPADLPSEIVTAIEDALEQRDPGAERRTDIGCPACGHAWAAELDVPAFLWAELEAGARRTLYEVHLLASRYGWSEAEVLRVTPMRRGLYLEAAVA